MRIENRTRTTVLGSRVILAASWWGRFRGLVGRPEPLPGEGLLLTPCNSVHSWGLRYDLDVLFLDAQGKVLKLIRSLRPWRFARRVRHAEYVLEVPPGVIDRSGTREGDMLTWWDPAPVSIVDRIRNGNDRLTEPFASARGNP